MDGHGRLPFLAGQHAEARSFQLGFRGAWFRCKIKEISSRKGHLWYNLEYFDFPDEKARWTKLYQVPQLQGRKSKETKRTLMVRPQYPPVHPESQMPSISAISEGVVIVGDVWKVGDMVDWWKDSCYWSGQVTQILGNDEVRIELPQPPVGEGDSYEVSCKDLRPSLDWSPEHGWTVPTRVEGGNSYPCARLLKPVNQEVNPIDEGRKNDMVLVGSKRSKSREPWEQTSSNSNVYEESKCKSETKTGLELRDCAAARAKDTSEKMEELFNSSGAMKKFRTSGGIALNSMGSDTLEAAIMDLEELVNKVKWLKRILEYGVPFSKAVRPRWEFVEHRAPSTPK